MPNANGLNGPLALVEKLTIYPFAPETPSQLSEIRRFPQSPFNPPGVAGVVALLGIPYLHSSALSSIPRLMSVRASGNIFTSAMSPFKKQMPVCCDPSVRRVGAANELLAPVAVPANRPSIYRS